MFYVTLDSKSKVPFPRQLYHSYIDFKQSIWNLVCGILWLKPNTKRNFSSFGPVVSELWPIFLDFFIVLRTLSFSLFFCYFSHIFGHISGTTGPIGLKFFVRADFGHGVLHTKFQPLRLKDAEDIGWCGWLANGAAELQRSVINRLIFCATLNSSETDFDEDKCTFILQSIGLSFKCLVWHINCCK